MSRIVTYHSANADNGKEWAAYLVQPNGDYLPVRFHGATEDDARLAAQAEWDKHEAERAENIARRETARIKAAETKARKAGASA
jgi:hypothetical protein